MLPTQSRILAHGFQYWEDIVKKKCYMLMLLAFCAVWAAPQVWAADAAPTNQVTAQVTQAELARLLVEVLGLSRFLPANPTPAQCFVVLMANGIVPKDGWNAEMAVTRADLARVVVQAMKKTNEIKNPDKDQEWIDFLVGLGIPIDTVGLATKPLEPLALPVSPHAYTAQMDPLQTDTKQIMTPITQYGTVMTPIRQLFSFQPVPLKPVTPTGPQGAKF